MFAVATGVTVPSSGARAQSYSAIVEMYLAGEFEAATKALREIPPSARQRAADMFLRSQLQPFQRKRVQAMLQLETEATIVGGMPLKCLVAREPWPGWAPGPLSMARKPAVLEMLEDATLSLPDLKFLRAWYVTVIAYDQGREYLQDALGCFDAASVSLRRDPEMLLALGAIHESAWQRNHQDGITTPSIAPDLEKAEEAYRAALSAAPTLLEAELRLARILAQRSDNDEALRILHRLKQVPDKDIAYLACLFEGDILERREEYSRAAESYLAARNLMPDAQSPGIALAFLAHRQGRRIDAAAAVVETLGAANRQPGDPFDWYYKGTARRTSACLVVLRALVQY